MDRTATTNAAAAIAAARTIIFASLDAMSPLGRRDAYDVLADLDRAEVGIMSLEN